MANLCCSEISIYSTNKEGLTNLFFLLNKWTSKKNSTTDFDEKWLGNIVINSGIGDVDDIPCRGRLEHVELLNGSLEATVTTAWRPEMKMWRMLIEKYLPNAEIVYSGEEPGCEVFFTNDPDLYGAGKWEYVPLSEY